MIFRTVTVEDGAQAIVLDDEGIEWLMAGLEQLRDSDVHEALMCPSFVDDREGGVSAATDFYLKRHDPENPTWSPADIPTPEEEDPA